MDFEFCADQEMLRESVRRFLADKAPIAYVRDAYEHDAADARPRRRVGRPARPRRDRPARARGARRRGHGDGRRRGRARGARPRAVPGALRVVGDRRGVARARRRHAREHQFLLPGLADGSTIGTLALFEPAPRYEWRAPAQRGAAATARRGGSTARRCTSPTAAAANLFLVTARRSPTACSACSRSSATTSVRVEPTPTVDGSRKEATRRASTARRRGGSAAATRPTRSRARSTGSAVAYVVDGVGAAQRALELAVEYAKERVQFDKPIGSFQAVQHLCADMLRALELGRAAGYYACWAADDAEPDGGAPRRGDGEGVRERRVRAARRHRDPGVRRHRLHVGARHPPVLQAPALAVGRASATASEHLAELAHIAID